MKLSIAILVILLGWMPAVSAQEFIPGNDFNEYVLVMLKSYPTNGTHKYHWPKSGGWSGNTCDLHYRGQLFLRGDALKRCYCCGLTFEVFFRAYEKYCRDKGQPFIIKNFDHAALRKFKGQWFGSDGNITTLQNAVVNNNLGKKISIADARPGDFVQFWRYSGSGHSVIFVGWARDHNQRITGIQYWSTQGSTNGIGYRTEYFTNTGVNINKIYIARVGY